MRSNDVGAHSSYGVLKVKLAVLSRQLLIMRCHKLKNGPSMKKCIARWPNPACFHSVKKYRITMCLHGLLERPSHLCGLKQEDSSLLTLEFLTNLEGL